MKEQQSARHGELDALRGVAAVMVMAYHYTSHYGELFGHAAEPGPTFPPGRYGVQLFFVISGFVIFLTLERSGSVRDFVANRISRLYPAYWACVLATAGVLAAWPLPGLEVTAGQVVINLSMAQYWLLTEPVDGVYWTLSVELAFYAFMVALRVLGWLGRVERWVSVWLALEVAVRVADEQGVMAISPLIRTALLLDHGHYFFAGVLFHRISQGGGSVWRWVLIGACVATAWVVRDGEHAAALAAVCLVFALFARGKLRWLATAPLMFLGDLSYPLYLLHQNIGYVVISALQKGGHTQAAWLLVPAAGSIVMAYAAHRWIEKPAREALRRAWAGRKRERR